MLTLTPAAADAVHTLMAHRHIDRGRGGLRIASRPAPEPGSTLKLAVVERPHAADAELEARGAHLFVEPALADALADKVLDAEVEGGLVRFALLAPPGARPLIA
jgi:Fe-S cluster assembly iron-binding protein IscA